MITEERRQQIIHYAWQAEPDIRICICVPSQETPNEKFKRESIELVNNFLYGKHQKKGSI